VFLGFREQRTAVDVGILAGRLFLRALRAPFLAALLAAAPWSDDARAADRHEPPRRIVSMNVCTDQFVMLLAERERIQSVSWLARNPEVSTTADDAAAIPVNHGLAEEILPLRPDLVVAGTFTTRPTVYLLRRLGPNGAGKSTLLRLLTGLLDPDSGRVLLDGTPLAAVSLRERARAVGYLPQDGVVHWRLTVAAVVALGRLPHQGAWGGTWAGPSSDDRAAVARAMQATGVAEWADRPLATLSGGERGRVLLARARAGEPRILLVDEPTAGLDPGHALDAMTLLQEIASGGTLVIAVLHDLTLAARFCDRLLLLHEGVLQADGPPAEVLTPAALARVYGVTAIHGARDGALYVVPWARTAPDHVAAPVSREVRHGA
jgi:iron complex transport system ATP-binding protein